MNIVILDTETLGDVPEIKSLLSLGKVTAYKHTTPKFVKKRIRDAEIVITNKVKIGLDDIEDSSRLKLICVAASIVDVIDVRIEKRKIKVVGFPGYATNSVAQFTFAVLLTLLNNIEYFDDFVKRQDYSKGKLFTHLGKGFWELHGKKFGIIGLGKIGERVAEIATTFGAEVFYYSTSGRNHNSKYKSLSLEQLLKQSDVVSIHAPLNEQTKNLISFDKLSLMKKTAILINTGRGGIVNEKDLAKALNSNVIAGCAIDVFEKEPLPIDSPLLKVRSKNKLILTPHCAWASLEARGSLIRRIVSEVKEFSKIH
jgi:lactate dehydrogenase-like 2-hydroxyacid dehydrogenase